MTRVPELMAAGVTVAMGHDDVQDPWYPLGSGDMLEVAHMGAHVAHMTGATGIRACYDAVTKNAARVMGLAGYGIDKGCDASFVLLQASDAVDAVRLRANRLKVWKAGRCLAESAESVPALRSPLGA
jgi:cytosine/creatinine deaminase